MSKPTRVPERQAFRIDHTDFFGERAEWFYSEVFRSEAEAQAYIDDRDPKYRDLLEIVEYTEPEHDSYHLGVIKL